MNIQKLMKQMQKVQADAQKMQEEIAGRVVEGTAGGGAVVISLTGGYEVRGVKITPEALEGSDSEMVEDMVKAALEDALGKIAALSRDAMSKAMGGVEIPGFAGKLV